MDDYKKEIQQIQQLLKNNPKGMTVTDIAIKIKTNRNSVAKYLDIMRISGFVEMITFGPAKVFFPSRRIPIREILNYVSDMILIINNEQKIVFVNNKFTNFINKDRDNLIGEELRIDLLPILNNREFENIISDTLNGNNLSMKLQSIINNKEVKFEINTHPIAFEDGKTGGTIIIKEIV